MNTAEFVDAFRQQSVSYWCDDLIAFVEETLPAHLSIKSPEFHKAIYTTIQLRVIETSASNAGHSRSGVATPPINKQSLTPTPPRSQFSNYSHIALVEPRGFGKTTKLMGVVLWAHLLGHKKLSVYFGKSYESAVRSIGAVRAELETNKMLGIVFGDVKSSKWTEGEMELRNGSKIVAMGRGQSIRGLKHLQYRPDLVILDDIDDENSTDNPDEMEKTESWFDKAVIPALDSERGLIIAVGTVLNWECLLAKLTSKERGKYEFFKPYLYKALDEGESSIWEEKFPTKVLLDEKKRDPYAFAQERMNEPIPVGAGMFRKDMFRYYTFEGEYLRVGEDLLPIADLFTFITVDLAVTDKETSDYTVLMVTGVDSDNQIYVLEYTKERWADPEKIIHELFRLYHKWHPKVIGIETVNFQKWLVINLQKEMRKRGEFLPLTELRADRDKTRRISQLQPRFLNGAVFLRNSMLDLEEELLLFPKAPHDDVSDALAYLLQIMSSPPTKQERKSEYMTFDWWKGLIREKRSFDRKSMKHSQMPQLITI